MNKQKATNKEQTAGSMAHRRQILNQNSNFVVKEAYKTLRTNLRFTVRGEGCKKICITSGNAGEGKSITLMNLAITIAEGNQRVLVIDADLRRPALARLLVEKATPGLANVLADMVSVDEAIRKDIYPNLDVLFSGEIAPNPSELLGSERLQQMLTELESRYDYILMDTPPVNVVSDACVVANYLDGVLLLVRQGKARKDGVKQALSALQLTGAKVLGYILNGVSVDGKKKYKYYD